MNKDNNRGIRDWNIFIRAAGCGSFSEAARELTLSPAAVCKAIDRLENYLGTVLFNRDTRGTSLTAAGRKTLLHAQDISLAFQALLEDVRNPDNDVKGSIRLSAPAIVCEFLANEWAYDFVQAHPLVTVFLDSREKSDLNRDSPEFDDLVLRSGRIECEDLVHRRLSSLQLVLCASPDYLRAYPSVRHPRDLENHTILGLHHHGLAGNLTLFQGDESYTLDSTPSSGVSSNNLFSMLNLAIKGKGISLATPGWLASGYTQRDDLEIVLPEWKLPELPVWLVWRHRAVYTPLFMSFRDYVEQQWNTRLRNLPVDNSRLQPSL